MISETLRLFFYGSTALGLVFLFWLIYISPKIRGEGAVRNRAIGTGIAFLVILILPDIWALTRLRGISWFVAWAIGLLFFHIIEGGIWHRICWGDKCPECGAWLDVKEEKIQDNPSMARKSVTCAKCGYSDSWSIWSKSKRNKSEESG